MTASDLRPLPQFGRYVDRAIPVLANLLKGKADGMPGEAFGVDLPDLWRLELFRDPASRRYSLRFVVGASAVWGPPAVEAEAVRIVGLIGFTNGWRLEGVESVLEGTDLTQVVVIFREAP